jgi:hypothetical protein
MIGSAGVASWIAHAAFWVLIAWGVAAGELALRRAAVFLLLWLTGLFGLPRLPYEPARAMFSSFVAVLDVVLVFVIFKGDVRFG